MYSLQVCGLTLALIGMGRFEGLVWKEHRAWVLPIRDRLGDKWDEADEAEKIEDNSPPAT